MYHIDINSMGTFIVIPCKYYSPHISEILWHRVLCIISSTQIFRFAYTFLHNHILHIDTQKAIQCIEASISTPFIHFTYFDLKVHSFRGKKSGPTWVLTKLYKWDKTVSRVETNCFTCVTNRFRAWNSLFHFFLTKVNTQTIINLSIVL